MVRDSRPGGIGPPGWRCGEGWRSALGKYFLCFSEKEQAARSRFQAFEDRKVYCGDGVMPLHFCVRSYVSFLRSRPRAKAPAERKEQE